MNKVSRHKQTGVVHARDSLAWTARVWKDNCLVEYLTMTGDFNLLLALCHPHNVSAEGRNV